MDERSRMPIKYTPEFKVKALQLIEEHVRVEQCSALAACTKVGETLGGISPHTLRKWWKRSGLDRSEALGVSTDRSEEIHRLHQENRTLRDENEWLRHTLAYFAARPYRPHRDDPDQ